MMGNSLPLTRVSLRILVVHTGTQSLQHSSASKVLRCDELQTVRLPVLLFFYDVKYLKHKGDVIRESNTDDSAPPERGEAINEGKPQSRWWPGAPTSSCCEIPMFLGSQCVHLSVTWSAIIWLHEAENLKRRRFVGAVTAIINDTNPIRRQSLTIKICNKPIVYLI